MKIALARLATACAELDDDPLYSWIAGSHHDDPRRHYDAVVPILDFILTFPSYNDLFLAYPSHGSEHAALRRVINEHAAEDRTHARLFLRDLRTIGLTEVWGLTRPSIAMPVSDGQRRAVLALMDVVAGAGLGQFDALARALTTDRARFGFLEETP